MLNTSDSILSALSSDPIKSITAFAAIISASAAIGGLIVGWKNLKKDTTRVSVVVKRAQNGPLILQHPQEEFLLFEVYNQGISPVVINEVGIKIPHKCWWKFKLINLVDLPESYLHMRGHKSAVGTLECVGVPGTIPARSTGIFLLSYSRMREASINYQKQSISPLTPGFVGSQRVIKAFQEFQKFEISKEKCLKIVPYVLTGSGEYFFGKKAIIKLGNLGDVVFSCHH
ncbi:hypothetical protein IQ244_02790 [Nostoc sp. LEGE 06077]|uniref:hypothetical protein n=1 Tax=Nostoc sp. LEGE 06077 TaxID=915325 RepID=UPI00188106E5|nr:hypothetical protein [Nostoc sp. LEGE 06077]MBE9205475.1 hypothetical protein [Nostoc sp. LEGE 06077]